MTNIRIRTIGSRSNIALIKIRGSLDTPSAYDLEKRGNSLMKDGISKYIINLEHLDYVSSAGIECFHTLAYKLRKNHGEIIFTNVPEKIYRIFDMVGVTKVFRVKNTTKEALEEFEQGNDGRSDHYT